MGQSLRRALCARLVLLLRDDRGSVSAEFAVVLPVIAAVLALCMSAVALTAQQLRLTAASADVARSEARGESHTREILSTIGYPVDVQRSRSGKMHCVVVSATPAAGVLSVITLSGRSCAVASDLQ